MARKRPDGIRDYNGPAGGWGALKAVALALKDQQAIVRAGPALLSQNKPDGFDCPSCAWPDPNHTSSFEFCENGAKAVAWEATSRKVDADFFKQHSVADLWSKSDYWLEDQGRLTEPLRYNDQTGHFEPVAWDVAFKAIGDRLAALDDPDKAEFYTSGRASNESAFIYQLFVRQFGTNNFPDCSNMCHEATSVGLPKSIGVAKGTVSLEDFDNADLILSFGHNPGTNHPRMMATLRDVRKRGAKIVVFNPLRERALEKFESPQSPVEMLTLSATQIASTYFQLRVGGDAAAIKGICKALLKLDADARAIGAEPVLDHAFIAENTAGFDAFAADLEATGWDHIERQSGLSRAALESAAAQYANAKSTIVCYGMGITQHVTGTSNVQQLVNLLLLKGNIGRAGAGICPLRGHSNVQGDRTMGIWERPSKTLLDNLGRVFDFEPPRERGHSVVNAIAAMCDGAAKAVICLGGNLAVACADPQACSEGFRNVDMSVHIATKLNRTHLMTARRDSFILPCLGRTDIDEQTTGPQHLTVEDSMSVVHASRGFVKPPGDLVRSEVWIIANIAKSTLRGKGGVDWDGFASDYDLIRDKIEAVFPDFAGMNAQVRTPGGFTLPNAAARREWRTETGKANFLIAPTLEEDDPLADPFVLNLTTMRSHDQFNTTIYGLNDRYRGVFGRRDVVFMNVREMDRRGLQEGDLVDLVTVGKFARADRICAALTLVEYNLPDGCCGAYYPETQRLVALEYIDPISRTPAYKSVPVHVRKSDGAAKGHLAVEREGVVGRPL